MIWRDTTWRTLPAKDSLLSPVFLTLFLSRTNTYLNINHPSNSVQPKTWRELSDSQDSYLCINLLTEMAQNLKEQPPSPLSWTEQEDQRRAQPGSKRAALFSDHWDVWLHCTFPPFFFLCHLLLCPSTISLCAFDCLSVCHGIAMLCMCVCVCVCAHPSPHPSSKTKKKKKKKIWDKLSKYLLKLNLHVQSWFVYHVHFSAWCFAPTPGSPPKAL